MAVEVERLDLGGFFFVTHAAKNFEVEVHFFGAHAPDVEGNGRAVKIGRNFDLIVDDGRSECQDFEVFSAASCVGSSKPLVERGLKTGHSFWRKEDGEPTIGDLGSEGDVLRSLGAQDDGNFVA